MEGVLPQLLLVAVLVLVNAAFAGSELALVSLREGQLRRLEIKGGAGKVLARLAREPNRFLATIQIGITLAGFLASAAAAVSLAEPLESPLGFLGTAARPAAVVLVTLVLAYLTLVLGELAPKRVALQHAERWGLLAARPLAFLAKVTRPAVWLLSHSTDLAVRVLGGDPHRQREDVTEEELRDMLGAHDSFSSEQRTILTGAFEIADRTGASSPSKTSSRSSSERSTMSPTATSSPSSGSPAAAWSCRAPSRSMTSPTSPSSSPKATTPPWPGSCSTLSATSPNRRERASPSATGPPPWSPSTDAPSAASASSPAPGSDRLSFLVGAAVRDTVHPTKNGATGWAGEDSNLRRLSRQNYSLLPLAAWVPTRRPLTIA